MAIIKWDPFQNVAMLQERINKLFDDSFPQSRNSDEDLAVCAWRPTVDIYEGNEGIIIRADLPGVRKEAVAVEVKDNILSLKGERTEEASIPQDRYYRKERCCGAFHRAFTLEYTVSPEKIKASFKDGVLEITIPKPERERPKKIEIEVE